MDATETRNQSRLVAATDELTAFSEKLSAWLEDAKKGELTDVLKMFAKVRDQYDLLDDQRKKVYATLEHMSRSVIPDMMQEKDIKTISLAEAGLRFSVAVKISASMPDKLGGMAWLRSNGHGDLIQETVNASSLSAFAKTYIADTGKELPEAFKVSNMTYTSVTKL
jgi:hypothetical protein